MLSLLLFLALYTADAAEQKRVYELLLGGKTVGKQEVELIFLPGATGEVRLIQSYTELDIAALGASFRARTSGRVGGGSPAFTSTVEDRGQRSEVQGRQRDDRLWQVTVAEPGSVSSSTLRASEVDLTSLDLLDTQRWRALEDRTEIGLLSVETGLVLVGALEDKGEDVLRIGSVEVPVHRYWFTPQEGRLELCFTPDGLLVRYELMVWGNKLVATLDSLPPPPTFDVIEATPSLGGGMEEEGL